MITDGGRARLPILLTAVLGVLIPWTSEATPNGKLDELLRKADQGHPRLLADGEEFKTLPERIEGNERLSRIWEQVRRKADLILKAEPLERKMTGRRLLSVSRSALDRTLALAMAYKVTGDARYLERGKMTLGTVAGFSDWNPSHFLDVAEMAAAVSIGYDWLYDDLTPEFREVLRKTLVEKALEPSFKKRQWWIKGTNNWNQVCHGGLTLAALAVLEDEPQWALKVIGRALDGIPSGMRASYAPNGNYPEGPGYWNYGTSYNVILIAALEQALGTDFGLAGMPGFGQTGSYVNHAAGPTGLTFNYADGGASVQSASPALFWLARRFDRPDWVTARLKEFDTGMERASRSRFFPLNLLWAPRRHGTTKGTMPLDWKGEGHKPVTMHRSGWNPEAFYLGVCAGSPSSNHGHMDIGSFIFECDGVRWVEDLGAQSYHSLESKGVRLWDRDQEGDRWGVFRLNNFSHNTLTIGGELQRVDGFARITGFSDAPECPSTVVDLSPVYAGQVAEAERSFHLPGRRHLVIRDRLEGVRDGRSVTWRMMTGAAITLQSEREAILTRDGKSLRARLLEPTGASWSILDASKPRSPIDAPNPGKSLLECTAQPEESGDLQILVVLEPGDGDRLPGEAALNPAR